MANNNTYKVSWKEHLLYIWFNHRKAKLEREYALATPYKHHSVSFKGRVFNPAPSHIRPTDVVEVTPEDPMYELLESRERLYKQIEEATGHITYVLNFCDDANDVAYLLKQGENIGVPRLDKFRTDNEERFQLFKKYALLADLTKE